MKKLENINWFSPEVETFSLQANSFWGQMISTFSHDIQNHLVVTQGFAQRVSSNTQLNNEELFLLQKIRWHSLQMEQLAQTISQMRKLLGQSPSPTFIRLDRFFTTFLSQMKLLIALQQVQIHLDISPTSIAVDPLLFTSLCRALLEFFLQFFQPEYRPQLILSVFSDETYIEIQWRWQQLHLTNVAQANLNQLFQGIIPDPQEHPQEFLLALLLHKNQTVCNLMKAKSQIICTMNLPN